MSSKYVRKWTFALALVAIGAGVALATVTFDPQTGVGFVGKGDVQLIYGWKNAQLQQNAKQVQFQVVSEEENAWTCSRPAPTPRDPDREITQQRNNTTTTEGLVTTVARERNQVTGFNLIGYSEEGVTTSTDGPVTGACPANPSGFTFDEGSLVTTPTQDSQLQVSTNGTDWVNIP